MAKNIEYLHQKHGAMLYSGRNKDFGAYQLRLDFRTRHLKAFIISFDFFCLLYSCSSYLKVGEITVGGKSESKTS